jgi:hypothetical protein
MYNPRDSNQAEFPGGRTDKLMRPKTGTLREQIVTGISGDRRSRRRFDLDLPLQYKVVGRYRLGRMGVGKTINMSATGIAFEAEEPLSPGVAIELSLAWPVLLNQTCPLKLVITGKVVRSGVTLTALRMDRYEFHTQGTGALRVAAAGYSV